LLAIPIIISLHENSSDLVMRLIKDKCITWSAQI